MAIIAPRYREKEVYFSLSPSSESGKCLHEVLVCFTEQNKKDIKDREKKLGTLRRKKNERANEMEIKFRFRFTLFSLMFFTRASRTRVEKKTKERTSSTGTFGYIYCNLDYC